MISEAINIAVYKGYSCKLALVKIVTVYFSFMYECVYIFMFNTHILIHTCACRSSYQ